MPVAIKGPTEAAFLKQVLALARLFGWKSFHQRPGLTQSGKWCSAVQGDGVGHPDAILIRRGVLVVAELKVGKNRTTPEQDAWLEAYRAVPGAMVFVWKPEDWGTICEVLK